MKNGDYKNIQYLNIVERNGLNVITFQSKLEKKGIYEIKVYINNSEKILNVIIVL